MTYGVLAMVAVVAALLCLLLTPLARRRGWLDLPSGRKVHASPTPLVGGIAIYLAFLLGISWTGTPGIALAAACFLALLCGLVDDLRPLPPAVRFFWQALACLVMIFAGDVMLTDFGRLMWDGTLELGVLSVPITVFAALGVINAFNMIDGVDGLAGTVFLVCAVSIGWLAGAAGMASHVQLLAIAACAVGGFLLLNARLPWNSRARVFLGDSGSTWLGLFLAWMFIDLGNGADRAFAPMTAVWIIGLPLLDTTRLIGTRWLRGQAATAADQQHLHHALLMAGFSVPWTSCLIALATAMFALAGILFERCQLPEYLSFYAFIACGLVYFAVMQRAWRQRRILGRAFRVALPADRLNGSH